VDEQIRRLIDQVHQTICQNEDEFRVAEGKAVVTVFKHSDPPRIELTSSKTLAGVGARQHTASAPRLSGDIRVVADDVRRKLFAEHAMVQGAHVIEIEIYLRGPRPSFHINYRTHRL
jgi:hypothetical protein